MDKQEAIDYVLDELDKGRSPAEITAALSRKLGAPVELVAKFVRQTKARYEESRAALGESFPASQQAPAVRQQPTTYTQQPPMDRQQPPTTSQQPPAYSLQPVADIQKPAAYLPPTYEWQTLENQALAGAAAAEPLPEPDPYVGPTQAETEPAQEPEMNATIELEKFIIDALGKDKRQSDIVLEVVERTGMDYRQAQRMVSSIGARDFKKVTAKRNCLIIPLALVFLIAGMVLLGASILEGYQLRFILDSPNNLSGEQIQQAYEAGQNLPWAFITGLALALGGGIGLIAALRRQME